MTEEILRLVRERCGVDLSGYRRSTLERRVHTRMRAAGAATLDEYEALLGASDGEARRLLERVTIKVSRFYRDPDLFDALASACLPELAARHIDVDMWCAGCARGEEAYTLAMLLEDLDLPGTVLATDLDEGALDFAERGVYPAEALTHLPRRLADRWLEPRGSAFAVVPRLRRRVRFARHDLARDLPPGGPFPLVSCRNVLIYWSRAVQEAIVDGLVRATSPGGLLALGDAERPTGPAAERLRAFVPGQRIYIHREAA